jgi:predicted ABC-type ATPase
VTSRALLVVLLAGPNGAGKSTIAERLLKGVLGVQEFLNADVIAQGLSTFRSEDAAVAAGRIMMERLRDLAAARRDFGVETTLAGRSHGRWLRELRTAGYRAQLFYMWLPSADLAVARVAQRVREGGHHVAEDVVRRRFAAGRRNLDTLYEDAVDGWHMYDNGFLTGPNLIAGRRAGVRPVGHCDESVPKPGGTGPTSDASASELPPSECVNDYLTIRNALRQAVRAALLRHKLARNPAAVWGYGRVAWIEPQDLTIPSDQEQRTS